MPFLLIWHGGFWVHSDALSEPWMMTRTAMNSFRNAVCHDSSGTTCTIIDVIPLRAVTLRDRMLPWRQIPVRPVRQAWARSVARRCARQATLDPAGR